MNKLIVFPTSRAIREYTLTHINQNTLLPKLLSIDELFKNIININKKRYIDDNLRIIYLKEAIDFDTFDKIGISSNMQEFWKQSDFIFRFLGELAHEDIDIDSLNKYDTYAHYEEHLAVLKQVKENYINILDKHNLIDKLNLPSNYTLNIDYIKSFDTIHIILEGYLSKFEYKLIQELSQYNTTILEFTYNEFNQKSILQIDNDILNLQINHKYKINISSNTIITKQPLLLEKSSCKLFAFESKINQVAFIKQSIYDAVVNQHIQPQDIVVVLPDESFAHYLKLFDNENYLNFAFGFDIFNTNIYKVFNAINNFLNDSKEQNKDLLTFLNIDFQNQFFIDMQTNWTKQINENHISIINNYILNNTDNKEIILSIEKVIFSLSHVFLNNNIQISLKNFFKILLQKLQKLTIDDTKGGKITVMGLLETRAINFKAVIVCDFNDDIVPKRSSKDKFLSTHIKQLASLPTSLHRQNLQAYYYDKLFKQSNHLYISYVQNDTSILSRFATKLLDYKLSKMPVDKQFQDILYIHSSKEYEDDTIQLDIDLSKQIWSASSLKRYLTCKRQYYYHNIQKIKEHYFDIKPQGFELGNIIHNVLEAVYNENSYFTSEDTLYKSIIDKINQYDITNPYLIFDIELLKKKIKTLVTNDIQRFNNSIKVIACEKPFKFVHNGITFTGTIDRIDKNKDDSIDIIDYKTSKTLKVDTPKTYQKSIDFQLEIYFLALDSFQISNICYYNLNNGQLLNEIMIDEKLILLDEKLEELHTTTVSFDKCDDIQKCKYCPYSTICKRD
jgi:hypothetical protein